MQEIVKRMKQIVDIQYISEEIMKKPINEWPVIHTLIAFQSKGYPLHKVAKYVQQNKCCVINGNIDLQKQLMRRDVTKKILEKHHIDQSPYIIVHRNRIFCQSCKQKLDNIENGLSEQFNGKCTCTINQYLRAREIEFSLSDCDDCQYEEQNETRFTKQYISQDVNGISKSIQIPLIEKPIDSDDHNIYFYKPDCVIKMFRKIENKCSERISMEEYNNIINQDSNNKYKCIYRGKGCYVYEQFYEANGEDLKVYTIYPNYFLCEIRKAPYVDGVVQRDPETGKEIRTQVKLKHYERTLATRVCIAFQQLICGFDIVRTTDGRSLVIDCNGFSFVKCNQEYYEISSRILANMVLQEEKRFKGDLLQPQYFNPRKNYIEQMQNGQLRLSETYLQFMDTRLHQQKFVDYIQNQLDMRAVVDVIRHGDRSIKFEYMFYTTDQRLIQVFYTKETQSVNVQQNDDTSISMMKIRPQKSKQRTEQILVQLNDYLQELSQELQIQIDCNQIMDDSYLSQFKNSKEIIGVNNLIFLLKNSIAGTKIVVITTTQSKEQPKAKIMVKWSGQLTISGLRESFKIGQKLRQRYFQTNQLPSIKFLHSSKRLAQTTGQYILLGFLANTDDIEEVLPFLKCSPYTESSFIAPDLFKYLQNKYPNNQKIPFLQNYTCQEFQTFFVGDEDQILVTYDEHINSLMKLQHKIINEIVMEKQDKYMAQNDLQYNKIKLSTKPYFDQVLFQFQQKEKQLVTHYQILDYAFNILLESTKQILQKAKDIGKQIRLVQMNEDGIPTYSNQSMTNSIMCLFNQFKLPTKQLQFNVAKIIDTLPFLKHMIVHHSDLIDDKQKFRECYTILEAYNIAFTKAIFSTSQLFKQIYGQAITFDLLNSIQDDIQTTYQYNRECEEIEQLKTNNYKQSTSQTDFVSNASDPSLEDNNQVSFAKDLKHSHVVSTQLQNQQNLLEDGLHKPRLVVYITNEIHQYCLKNLLSETQNNELTRFVNQPLIDNFVCNYAAEMQFIYYEISKTQQDLNQDNNEIHRLVEIKYSQGTSSDVFQPCEYNCLPCDQPEIMFSLFPFTTFTKYNTQLKKMMGGSQDYSNYELTSVVGVYRHGDRCPKQKVKVNIEDFNFFKTIIDSFQLNYSQPEDISCKRPKILPIIKKYLCDYENIDKNVLQCYEIIKANPPALKIQVKFPIPYTGQCTCQLIVKYGGTLTELGGKQSELAASLLYEQIKQEYQNVYNSQQRIKSLITSFNIYNNDEERVQMTEQYFVNKLAEIVNIDIQQMKQPQQISQIVDIDQRARGCMNIEKKTLSQLLTHDFVLLENEDKLDSEELKILKQIDSQLLEDLQNPYQKLKQLDQIMNQIMNTLQQIIKERNDNGKSSSNVKLSVQRFKNILDVFIISNDEDNKQYNVSKVMDVYDLVRFEALHPCSQNLQLKEYLQEAYQQSKYIARIASPLELGTTLLNRQVIASLIIKPMITHIIDNILNNKSSLYFVSESHIAALINILERETNNIQKLDFMSYVNFLVYKNKYTNQTRIEVFVSRGSYQSPFKTEFCVPRLQQPYIISDNWDNKNLKDLLNKVEQYTELSKERFDLGFGILN